MKKILLSLLAIIFLTSWTGIAQSQTNGSTVGLSLRPAIVEIAGDPNTSHEAQVIIENTSDKAIPVTVDVTSLIPIDDEIDRSRRAEFDASSWVNLDQKNLLLEPGESVPIKMMINIPAEANPGGHYAQVGFRVLSEANYNPSTNAQIIPEVAASLFITVPGDVNEKAEIDTTDIAASYVTKGSDTKFKFTISNTGNVHILPAPKVTISDKNGNIVKQISMQPQLVLPNTRKVFELDWPADVAYGKYNVKAETVYGSQNIPLSSSTSNFIVGPAWWQIAVVAVLIIPLLALLLRRRHLPNALKALRGKRIHLVGRSRYSRASNEKIKPDKTETVGELEAINTFLEPDVRPTKKLQVPVYPVKNVPPPITPVHIQNHDNTIEQVMRKKPEEPIEKIKTEPKVTVTEISGADDKDSKTIIVQTSASTIIRQEPKQESAQPSAPTPTIVRTDNTPTKPAIKINITDGKQHEPAPKAAKPKPVSQLTRSEQIAKKADAAKRKAKKKKIL